MWTTKIEVAMLRVRIILKAFSVAFSSSYSLVLPDEIAKPIVKYVSPIISGDGFPGNISISISRYNLILYLNEDLISPHFTSVQIDNNNTIPRKRLKNCYYQGSVDPFTNNGTFFIDWNAAVSICQGLQGHIGSTKYGYIAIFPYKSGASTLHQPHYLNYVSEDNTTVAFGVDSLQMNFSNDSFDIDQQMELAKDPFIELKIVNDKFMYEKHGKDVDKLEYNNALVINQVDILYQPLGIDVVIISMVTWTTKNMVGGYIRDDDGLIMIQDFELYNKENSPTKHDVAILFSNFQFTKIYGRSKMGGACGKANIVMIPIRNPTIRFATYTTAHEIGHALNMKHDEEYKKCTCRDPSGRCIMSNQANRTSSPIFWSSCSKRTAAASLKRPKYRCLYTLFGSDVSIGCGVNEKDSIMGISLIIIILLN